MNSVQSSLKQLISLYDSPMGAAIYRAEAQVLAHYLPDLLGDFLIQIAGPSDLSWFDKSPIRYFLRYSDFSENQSAADCTGELQLLPFASDSTAVILLPHTLEIFVDNTLLLTEVERCLVPGGTLILINFVPYRLFYWQSAFRQCVPDLHWRSYANICKSLNRQGFEIITNKLFFHRPFCNKLNFLSRFNALETLSQLLWPWMANLQMIMARKKRLALTPLINRMQPKLIINKINKELTSSARNQL